MVLKTIKTLLTDISIKYQVPGLNIFLILILILILVDCNSCYYDNEQDLYKYSNLVTCDLSNVTYAGTITPIINANCNICHSKTTASGGVVLDNYTDLASHISRVWGDINHFSGYDPMPKDGNMLSPCEINQIQAWMNKGTPNN
jgi:hypothetical protein